MSKPEIKAAIIAQMRITEDRYCAIQFEHGCEYLENQCSAIDAERLQCDAEFWAWWRMVWESREHVLLVQLDRGIITAASFAERWEAIHTPAALIERVPQFIERRARA